MEKHKQMSAAYAEATKVLRSRHIAEFHEILEGCYADRGLDVKKRLTGERKRQNEIAKARALLAAIEAQEG